MIAAALLSLVASDVQVDFDSRASFTVTVNGKLWLQSSALRVFTDHHWTDASSFKPVSVRKYTDADDFFGEFAVTNVQRCVSIV